MCDSCRLATGEPPAEPGDFSAGWAEAPMPADEAARLAALQALQVLDTPPEPEFDALVRAASTICGTPISLITLIDAKRQWFKANHGLAGVAGTPRDVSFCAHALLHDDLLVVPDATLDERFRGNPLVTADAGIRFYAGAPVRLSDGHVAGTLCVIDRTPRQLDASQRDALHWLAIAAARALEGRHAALALARRNALLDTTLRAIADAVLTTDLQGSVTWVNPAAERLMGRAGATALGVSIDAVLALRALEDWRALLAAASRGELTRLAPDALLDRGDTDPVAVEGSVSPLVVPSKSGPARVEGAVIVLRDTTAARRAAAEILHRATHDSLTGLTNRVEFERRLHQALIDAASDGSYGWALFIDLDHFKIVNDSCGHAAGDQLLQQFSGMLRDSVRSGDTVARLGGDEFAILLEHCPRKRALALAQKLCERLETFRFTVAGRRFHVGASIGLAPAGGSIGDVAAVMKAADECCYAAKEAGRNRVMAWPLRSSSSRSSHDVALWAGRIGRALDEDRFLLFGQIILPLHAKASGTKVEVLLRLRDDAGGIVSPGAFMPAAERLQMMSRIDRWVLHRTLAWMDEKLARCEAERVGVNLSGQSIADPGFRRWTLETLRAAGPALCAALIVEVTETVAIANLGEASGFLAKLRLLGVQVALDDFGAGASTFGYLKRLPLDYLKIDAQFVRSLLNDALDEAAIRSFVDVASVVGLQTVAEGVESAEVLARLRDLGIDHAQGYHLHRPAPLDTLCKSIAA